MLSLPDQLVDLLDEWGEAREQGEDHQKNCHQRFEPQVLSIRFDPILVGVKFTFTTSKVYRCM